MTTAEKWVESGLKIYNEETNSALTVDELLSTQFGDRFKVKKPKAEKPKLTDEQKKANKTAAAIQANETRRVERYKAEAPARKVIGEWLPILRRDNGEPNYDALASRLRIEGLTAEHGKPFGVAAVQRLVAVIEREKAAGPAVTT